MKHIVSLLITIKVLKIGYIKKKECESSQPSQMYVCVSCILAYACTCVYVSMCIYNFHLYPLGRKRCLIRNNIRSGFFLN